jgi:hypothetical protein
MLVEKYLMRSWFVSLLSSALLACVGYCGLSSVQADNVAQSNPPAQTQPTPALPLAQLQHEFKTLPFKRVRSSVYESNSHASRLPPRSAR